MCNYLQIQLYLHKKKLAKVLQWVSANISSFLAIFLFFCPEKFYLCNEVSKPDTELKNFFFLKI